MNQMVCASRAALCAVIAILITGCASRTPAPVVERMPGGKPPPVATPSAPVPPPRPVERPEFYAVRPGDTIYSIAVNQGVDYRDIIAFNGLTDNSRLAPGQVLRIRQPVVSAVPLPPSASAPPGSAPVDVQVSPVHTPPPIEVRPLPLPTVPAPRPAPATGPAPAPADPARTETLPQGVRTEPRAFKLPFSDENLAMIQRGESATAPVPRVVEPKDPPRVESKPEAPKPEAPKPPADTRVEPPKPATAPPSDDRDRVDWAWPTTGRVLSKFEGNNKGVAIGGKTGEPVFAAAGGRVVYIGTGLRGYGHLIIIKHNDTFLSAYAHNSKILVKESQNVTRGQKIAEIGSSDSDRPMLHFEIRKNGKPVDPLAYLPERP